MKQMTPFPPEGVVSGETNTPNPSETAIPSGNDGSGEQSPEPVAAPHPLDRARALAEQVDPLAFQGGDWASEETKRIHQDRALHFAIKVVDLGWMLVSDDETTVEGAAAAIAEADASDWEDIQSGIRHGSKWAPKAADYYRSLARAAVRALLGDQA